VELKRGCRALRGMMAVGNVRGRDLGRFGVHLLNGDISRGFLEGRRDRGAKTFTGIDTASIRKYAATRKLYVSYRPHGAH
jgi:hypothetical protein